jgi:hypothetical protein
MNDRDLLKLAAKAAGIVERIEENWSEGELPYFHTSTGLWRPLKDDGDALRLAVKLKIELAWYLGSGYTVVNWDMGTKKIAEYGDDTYSVTRRAIVLAAAEIGKKL